MSDDDEFIFPPLRVERYQMVRADVAEARIADLERQLSATRAELAEARQERMDVTRERNGLRVALEHIVRECGALHKGPVAVEIARAALAPVTESASEGGEKLE